MNDSAKSAESEQKRPFFSIVIPVHNGGAEFGRCLRSIRISRFTNWELVVVDDGSDDGSGLLAEQFGARVIRTPGRVGAAAARNLGAQAARGTYLFFTDADCALHPDTLANAARVLSQNPDLDALFGSYDDAPAAANFVSQYKNLFHHYVHQTSSEVASTFWTGCGVIRRERFMALGGFDARRFPRPCVEDIDLGYRLVQAGGRICLAKDVQVKHLKRWTIRSLLVSDVRDRAVRWTQLMRRYDTFTADLNLKPRHRLSGLTIYGLLVALAMAPLRSLTLVPAGMFAVLLLGLNADLYRFFYRKRGQGFTLRAVLMHWFYYAYSSLAFAVGLVLSFLRPPP